MSLIFLVIVPKDVTSMTCLQLVTALFVLFGECVLELTASLYVQEGARGGDQTFKGGAVDGWIQGRHPQSGP